MIDVFVRMGVTPGVTGVVAESVRWSAGADPAAARHQVVTLFGDPTVTHLAWAVAAANRGMPHSVWQIAADGSAMAAEHSLATTVLREDAAALLSSNGPQLRAAIVHLLSVRGQLEHSSAIRVPIEVASGGDMDLDAMLAMLREAEGDIDSEPLEDELAA
ncbi:MAG TPA: hypothetical protein VE861_05835 [Gemmatimonadaceae bacterium]|nr:hypothetical protein [Gemmatimonadaceae bacterium]